MASIESAGTVPGANAGLLDRERIIATAGFNRWLVPPAAWAIHLCIGMAYGFSVFWLPLSRAIGHRQAGRLSGRYSICSTHCSPQLRLEGRQLGWMFTLFFVFLGVVGGDLGRLAGAGRSAQGRGRRRAMLVRRAADLGARHLRPPAVDPVARLRRDRRHRPRSRLHFAGLDPGQMVPGPARHGDRHGHHGLRRRRHDRRAARPTC